MITKKEKKEYIEMDGSHCPKCKSVEIFGEGQFEIDCGYVYQIVSCSNCKEEWQDIYTLTGIYQG